MIISICEYRLTPKVAAKNPKPLVKMDLIEVLWAIRNSLCFVAAVDPFLVITARHQNRIIDGRTKLDRSDNDTRYKRKRCIRVIRNGHVAGNRKLDNRYENDRNGDGFKGDHDNQEDRCDGDRIYVSSDRHPSHPADPSSAVPHQ